MDLLFPIRSGTLHSRDEKEDTRRASLIKNRVRSKIKAFSSRSSTSSRPVPASEVMQALDYDPSKFSKKLKDSVLTRMYVVACILIALSSLFGRANRVLHAYSDDRPFSIELVGAVSNHALFVSVI